MIWTGLVRPHLTRIPKWPSSSQGHACMLPCGSQCGSLMGTRHLSSSVSCHVSNLSKNTLTQPHLPAQRLNADAYGYSVNLESCVKFFRIFLWEQKYSWVNLLKVLIVSLNRTKIDGTIYNNKARSVANRYVLNWEFKQSYM